MNYIEDIITPILLIMKQEREEVKYLVNDHSDNKKQSLDLNPGLQICWQGEGFCSLKRIRSLKWV